MKRRVATGCTLMLVVGLLFSVGAFASSTEDEVPLLLYGIIQLAETGDAITAEQAQELLPIVQSWQMRMQLGISSSTHATVLRIKTVLTEEQMDRIDAMHVTTRYVELWTSEQTGTRLILRMASEGEGASGEDPSPRLMTVNKNESMTQFADLVLSLLRQWAAA